VQKPVAPGGKKGGCEGEKMEESATFSTVREGEGLVEEGVSFKEYLQYLFRARKKNDNMGHARKGLAGHAQVVTFVQEGGEKKWKTDAGANAPCPTRTKEC